MNKNIEALSNQEIGIRIISRRKELGLTLKDVSNMVGVASSTIQRYEKGTISQLKLPVLESIAKAINVNPLWLINKNAPIELQENTLINEENILLSNFNKLNKEGKNEAIKRVSELTEINKYITNDNNVTNIDNFKGKKEKQIWEEEGKEHLMPIACHDDNLTDKEKAIVNEKINEILKNLDKH
ncbi:MAG: helix-turn-helix domain-containing protein [Clostridium sp.]|uniref:helix-turn-helix domain-containing protein n=1 Tax=Clostridium sp. TaxID=1506 RepID=UPI00399AF406